MIDRQLVADIIGSGNESMNGLELLAALEADGYRVVPEGLVPKFDDLNSTVWMLQAVGPMLRTLATGNAQQAVELISGLRDLALVVLRIDREDIQSEPTDG